MLYFVLAFLGEMIGMSLVIETPSRIEPCLFEQKRPAIVDLVALQRGELARGEAARVTGLKERSARNLLGLLVADGVLGSESPKGPVSLRFRLEVLEILFPNLFLIS